MNDRSPAVLPFDPEAPRRIRVEDPGRGFRHGDMVRIQYTTTVRRGRFGPETAARGRIIEKITGTDEELDLINIRTRYNLPEGFPKAVRRETESYQLPPDEFPNRKKIKGDWIVTIDSEDAKDLDDAVSLTQKNGIWKLSVHIADVTRFVRPGSELDREAQSRATSVYFGGQVIPMFPEFLSNGHCSLHPGEDKFALSCAMDIDDDGTVVRYDVFPSLIRISKRLSYNGVNAVLAEASDRSSDAVNLRLMVKLMDILKRRRLRDGSIDFDLDEIRIVRDSQGRVTGLKKHHRGTAERLVEEFMLIANQTVARFLERHKAPAIFRIHDIPDEMKVAGLNPVIQALKLPPLDTRALTSARFQDLIVRSKDQPEEQAVIFLVLRSMQQAVYCTENRGHFGLGFAHYVHFTSPIRRYPDFITHKLVKQVLLSLTKRDKKALQMISARELEKLAEHCTVMEKHATETERAYLKLKQVRWMSKSAESSGKRQKAWDAVVTGVTEKGVFVELLETPVEGLIGREDMTDDNYFFDERTATMRGRRSGRVYRLGGAARVRLKKVDLARFLIDFQPAGPD